MQPYYEDASGVIYHGDCIDIMKYFPDGINCITDPPYGIGKLNKFGTRSNLSGAMSYTPIAGDDVPFDPSHLLRFKKVAIFGANWFADKLPPSGGWLVWDKKDGGTSDNFSDAEMCWTNCLNTVRILHHKWRGFIRASEKGIPRVHPTQKPIAVMKWVMETCGIQDGATVLDPYAGSGTTLVAAKKLNRRYIGIELEEQYCEMAAKRLIEVEKQCSFQFA